VGNKLICKLVWGIGNDRFDTARRALLEQKIDSTLARGATVIYEIGRMNAVSGLSQHFDNRT
jgi:ABC-type uncharacterized transport system ATPase subunit